MEPSSLPYSLQHFGYYLIVKELVEASEQWNFMYPSTTSGELQKLFESKKYNEKLLAKLYWDYRDSCNPTARVSAQMEAEIRSTSSTQRYQPVWESSSLGTNYNSMHLVNNLYCSGDVNLKDSSALTYFPLSQWLTSEYQLNNIWIGLLKLVGQLKTEKTADQQNKIEQFEILLNFLHYVSAKCSIQPFYLQLLRSILKAPTNLLRSVSYPKFIQYENIQHTSFQLSLFKFLRYFGRHKRFIIEAEMRDCFNKKSTYTNENCPEANVNENKVNRLLQSWRANGELRSFLVNIQNHISLGPDYIRPNQSFLYSSKRQQKLLKQEHQNITNTVTSYLVRVHHTPNSSLTIKQFIQEIETHLHQRYMAPLSYRDVYRTRKELKLIESIEYSLKKRKYILRVTDKSGIFHLSHATDYEQKAEAYRQKTKAYIELPSNPLSVVFDKVVHLLNDLRLKEHIQAWQLDKMMPKRNSVALAYLYFIPKPHKATNTHILFSPITLYLIYFNRKEHHYDQLSLR